MKKNIIHFVGGLLIFFMSSLGLHQAAVEDVRLHNRTQHQELVNSLVKDMYILWGICLVVGAYFIIKSLKYIVEEITRPKLPPINYN